MELESLNLISGPGTKNVFDRIFKNILKKKITKSSSFIKEAWSLYLRSRVYNNDLNRNVFEGLLAILFYREGILPIFHKAKVAFVQMSNLIVAFQNNLALSFFQRKPP